MISITSFFKDITTYKDLGKEIFYPVQYGCKHCGYLGRLHRHGFYSRNVLTQYTSFRVFILRIKCPSCHKTYSILPSFLIPYHTVIKEKPMDKYIRHVDKLRFIPCREELDHIFLYRTIRSVKNDATLSIDNNLFEVPLKYVGERIHVRYDPTAMEKAYIFSEEGQILDTIYPVQKIDNTKVRREQNIKGIDFSPFSTH